MTLYFMSLAQLLFLQPVVLSLQVNFQSSSEFCFLSVTGLRLYQSSWSLKIFYGLFFDHNTSKKSTPRDLPVTGEDVSEYAQWCSSKVGVE